MLLKICSTYVIDEIQIIVLLKCLMSSKYYLIYNMKIKIQHLKCSKVE